MFRLGLWPVGLSEASRGWLIGEGTFGGGQGRGGGGSLMGGGGGGGLYLGILEDSSGGC